MENKKVGQNLKSQIPTEVCDKCRKENLAFGFTHLTSKDGGACQKLCSECYNQFHAKQSGFPEPETVNFPPVMFHDSVGKAHIFYFDVRLSTGLGIKSFELVDGSPGGYQFSVLEHPDTPVQEVYAKLYKKIEAGLAVRYIRSSDFGAELHHDRLYIKGAAVNGRICQRADGTPVVIVDGVEYTWEEFGETLTSHEGFQFRLECFDQCEETEISPNPQRPDPVWWLAKTDLAEQEPQYH